MGAETMGADKHERIENRKTFGSLLGATADTAELETGQLNHDHDHRKCVASSLAVAEELCAIRGVRLTVLRRRVLELVWRSHAPVGAYELLDHLRNGGRRAAPATIYRALDFLMEQKLVHRIESRNAYVGCTNPRHPHNGQYLICRCCGVVTELDDKAIDGTIAAGAKDFGFSIEHQTVELLGMCYNCAADYREGKRAAAT